MMGSMPANHPGGQGATFVYLPPVDPGSAERWSNARWRRKEPNPTSHHEIDLTVRWTPVCQSGMNINDVKGPKTSAVVKGIAHGIRRPDLVLAVTAPG